MSKIKADPYSQPDSTVRRRKQWPAGLLFRLTIVPALCLTLVACASLMPKSDQIKVTMVDVRPLESTLMEQRFQIKLRLQNRSRQVLAIDGMSFDLALNGKDFASGVSNNAVTIPAFDEAVIELKVSSSLFGVIRQVQSLQEIENKPFQYKISGSLSRTGSLFSLPFHESGEIDLGIHQ
ncbi:MAG: LEA type 2 family protein [Candidatus Thiodiazotropha sp. (ex Notomyrtea botanica)]|nr:LEA type 2 family protein [Candidatus Thiodiazotropha sp. (ex Notomyrtea botanica)]